MKLINPRWVVGATLAALVLSLGSGVGQERPDRGRDRGRWDPEEMRQRMMERIKEQLEITNEVEWQAIQPLVNRVMEARRDLMASNMRGFFGRGPGGGGPPGAERGDRGRGPFGQPSPEAEALEKAIESKASTSELKAAMAKYREARKVKEAALKQAQDDLRKVLSVRQEAIAVANGWLD